MPSVSCPVNLIHCLLVLILAGEPVSSDLAAQSITETKIRLMADALRARDSGDLELARRNLLKLSEMAPDDPAVKRLLKDVRADLADEKVRLNSEPKIGSPAASTNLQRAAPAAADSFEPLPPLPDPAAELAAMEAEIEAAAAEEETRQMGLIAAARQEAYDAEQLADAGRFDAAIARLDSAIWSMPENPLTAPVIAELNAQRDDVVKAQVLAKQVAKIERAPVTVAVSTTSERDPIDDLWAGARADYNSGSLERSRDALREVLALDPSNQAARRLVNQIDDELRANPEAWRQQTRRSLISEVEQAWRRPGTAAPPSKEAGYGAAARNPLFEKLDAIEIPTVSFNSVELQRVVSTLSDLSREFDNGGGARKGVNIIVIDPMDRRPTVSLTLRELSLKRVLDFITDSIGYQYEVQTDAIVMRPGGETSTLDTEFFPITRSTVIRMTGIGGGLASGGATAVVNDPFSPAPVATVNAPGGGSEAEALKQFLQQAGVDFLQQPGSNLAYDGSAMIVTQTTRNIERIRNILNRYNDVRQVEIEAKFMEIQEGALEELGVQWGIAHGINGDPNYLAQGQTQNRTVNSAFTNSIAGTTGQILNPGRETEVFRDGNGDLTVFPGQNAINQSIVNSPPGFPGSVDLASNTDPLATIQGLIGDFNVNAVVQALSRQTGSDLLSAPKVTVLSGNPATITVAQELRYPTSYGEVRSEVGSSSRDSSSAGVTITAGTPQDFETRKVGVELRVTPTVEEDDYSISLDLNPKVTEFEGFVEYGGQSVAISNDTTVTVPSGFYQPIFSTREVSTKVTLWDGATLVMGGLTREEIKTVNDKVPFLGSIPGLGRLFRSEGETTQKRNLLIFVTANLVSPGGSPKKQELSEVAPSSAFQNPVLVTPGGAVERN
jgi:general secretion pathway protein D